MMQTILTFSVCVVLFSATMPGLAQDPSTTDYLLLRVERYDIAVRLAVDESAADIQATLIVRNPLARPVSVLSVKLSDSVQLKSVVADGTTVEPRQDKGERRILNLGVTLPKSIAPGGTLTLRVEYRYPVEEVSVRAAINRGESYLLPESFWYPMLHTPYLIEHNTDVAPFSLSVTVPTGLRVVSSGDLASDNPQGDATTFTYQQKMLAPPMFVAREVEAVGDKQAGVEIYLPKGYALTDQEAVRRVRTEINQVIEFYSNLFGAPLSAPIRIIASSQVPFYGGPGLLILDERVFARNVLDEDSISFLAGSLARNWIAARFQLQGAGHGVLYDGLPGYLALLYIEQRYGPEAARRLIDGFRRSYLSIVSADSVYDAPLARQSLLNREYYTSIYNKVPMVLRLIEKRIGREKLLGAIKTLFSTAPGRAITLDEFRQALLATGEAEKLKPIFEDWFDQVILPDFAVGKPVQETRGGSNAWAVTVANFGTGRGEVEVEIVTPSGERLKQSVKVEAEGYAQALFTTPTEPASARVDTEGLYLQTNYQNDEFPRQPAGTDALSQGTLALIQGKPAEAEPKLRDAVRSAPNQTAARALLARALAALGRVDEAEHEANEALKQTPPSLTTWANAQLALGEVTLKRQQAAHAVGHFRQATYALAEDAPLLSARDDLIRAERAADQLPKPDENTLRFITQFDSTVSTGRPTAVRELVNFQNLKQFVASVSFLKGWKTEILRAQPLDARRVIVDVTTRATTDKGERKARAIYLLRQQGQGWILDDIPVFAEK